MREKNRGKSVRIEGGRGMGVVGDSPRTPEGGQAGKR